MGWQTTVGTLWRRHRRRGGAFAVALTVNAVVVAGFVASIQVMRLPEGRAITVTIVPPFRFQHPKPIAPKRAAPAIQNARLHTSPPPPPAVKPPPAPLPAPPKPLPTPPAPATAGKWTVAPDLHSQLVDQPSAQRYLRAGAACSKGELWKLPREEQDKCLARLGSKVPPDDGMHHHPPPNDPGGEFAAEIERRKEQARPMQGSPIGACPPGDPHRVCHSDEKGSLVRRLESGPQ
jgi:hypothetical protein